MGSQQQDRGRSKGFNAGEVPRDSCEQPVQGKA